MSPSDIKYKGPVHFTYERGFQQVAPAPVYNVHGAGSDESTEGKAHYVDPVAVPLPTSVKANEYGVFYEHTFPTLLNGTNAPGGPPSWYEKESKVDVLICGGKSNSVMLRMLKAYLTVCSRPVWSPSRHLPPPPRLHLPHCR